MFMEKLTVKDYVHRSNSIQIVLVIVVVVVVVVVGGLTLTHTALAHNPAGSFHRAAEAIATKVRKARPLTARVSITYQGIGCEKN